MYHFTIDLEVYDPIKNDKDNFDQYIEDATKIIDYIFDKLNKKKIKITCFVTNEFVNNFYEKFEKKIYPYHEISCHTTTHYFYNGKNERKFFESIKKNKLYLEKITGKKCYGLRCPGGIFPKNLLLYLIKLNFKYDSSVIPGIVPGRHYNFLSPKHPYYPDKNNMYKIGRNQRKIIEFPLSVLPFFRISTNGLFYPYFFTPFKNYYYNKETTTFVHLREFFDIPGKNFIWDRLKYKKGTKSTFNGLINLNKNRDMSLIERFNNFTQTWR